MYIGEPEVSAANGKAATELKAPKQIVRPQKNTFPMNIKQEKGSEILLE